MLAHPLQRGLELPVAIHADDPAALRNAQHFADAALHAAYARLGQGAGAVQLHQQDLVGLAIPEFLGKSPEVVPRHQPRLVVVGAEISCPGVWNIDGDERNVRLQVLGGDGGRN